MIAIFLIIGNGLANHQRLNSINFGSPRNPGDRSRQVLVAQGLAVSKIKPITRDIYGTGTFNIFCVLTFHIW